MPNETRTLEIDPDEALRILEESLSYYSPTAPEDLTQVEYEDLPLAA